MHLTKHHGLGNDFLVLLDLDDLHPIDEDVALRVCDRHRGVGADGLIRVTRAATGFRMELRNEDGSRAEMSGNGISCLAQALARAGHVPDGVARIETDAGPRTVTVVDQEQPARHRMRVAMGVPKLVGDLDEWVDEQVLRAVAIDVGNPHVVCHVPDGTNVPDLDEIGPRISDRTPGGTNVELVLPAEAGAVHMQVWERGVGPTEACGTGAVAAAVAAHSWGLAPAATRVVQPGGTVEVDLAGDEAQLTVPVVAVATVQWPL